MLNYNLLFIYLYQVIIKLLIFKFRIKNNKEFNNSIILASSSMNLSYKQNTYNTNMHRNIPSIKLFLGSTQPTITQLDDPIHLQSDRLIQNNQKISFLKKKLIQLQKILAQSSKQNQDLKNNNLILTKQLKQVNANVQSLFFKKEQRHQHAKKQQQNNFNKQTENHTNKRYYDQDQQSLKKQTNINLKQTNRYLSLNDNSKQNNHIFNYEQHKNINHARSISPQFRNIFVNYQTNTQGRRKASRGSCDYLVNKTQKNKIANSYKTPNNQRNCEDNSSQISQLQRYDSISYLSQNNISQKINQKKILKNYQNEKNQFDYQRNQALRQKDMSYQYLYPRLYFQQQKSDDKVNNIKIKQECQKDKYNYHKQKLSINDLWNKFDQNQNYSYQKNHVFERDNQKLGTNKFGLSYKYQKQKLLQKKNYSGRYQFNKLKKQQVKKNYNKVRKYDGNFLNNQEISFSQKQSYYPMSSYFYKRK